MGKELRKNTFTLWDVEGNPTEYVLPQGFYITRCIGGFEAIYDENSEFFASKRCEDGDGVILFRGEKKILLRPEKAVKDMTPSEIEEYIEQYYRENPGKDNERQARREAY